MSPVLRVVAVAALAVGLAACSADSAGTAAQRHATPTNATAAPTHPGIGDDDDYCLNRSERRAMFLLDGPEGDRLAALAIGRGDLGVVLAHHVGGSLCQWWPYARTLARAGIRVLAFDFDGSGASPAGSGDAAGQVVAAARWLRGHGTRRVVLMGGSLGGTASVVAAARLGHSVAGVVDLSGPAQFAGMDAVAAAARIRVPVLFGYGRQDGYFPRDVRTVRAAVGSPRTSLVVVADASHGTALVAPDTGLPRVRRAVLEFLRSV